MTIRIDIPTSIEDLIRSTGQEVAEAIREAAFVEFYRRGLISHGRLAEILGIARTQLDALLTRHGVTEDLMTHDELAANLDAARQHFG